MAKLQLTLACGSYDQTRALMDGTVQPEGIDLNCLPLGPGEIFWRVLNNEEFEMIGICFQGSAAQNSDLSPDCACQPAFSGSRLPSRRADWPAHPLFGRTLSDNKALCQPEAGFRVGLDSFDDLRFPGS